MAGLTIAGPHKPVSEPFHHGSCWIPSKELIWKAAGIPGNASPSIRDIHSPVWTFQIRVCGPTIRLNTTAIKNHDSGQCHKDRKVFNSL